MADEEFEHTGTPHHSGRYPWGSGKNPEQRGRSFLGVLKELEDQGYSKVKISEMKNIPVAKIADLRSIAKDAIGAARSSLADRLAAKGMSNMEIGRRMGCNESTVRQLRDPGMQRRRAETEAIAKVLRDAVEKKGLIDVGEGVENTLGIKRPQLNKAITKVEMEGYKIWFKKQDQHTTGKKTSMKILAAPGVGWDIIKTGKVEMITDHSPDGGLTFVGIKKPVDVDSKRIFVKYGGEGGEQKDGMIELRRGVPDLSLCGKNVAQVRVAVDGTHFMKGMAVYSDNVPEGYDIIWNTNKKRGAPKDKIYKPLERLKNGEIDQRNPFKSSIMAGGQRMYDCPDGTKKQSALNMVSEEGKWADWSKTLSSQVLSKQEVKLARKQLGEALDRKKDEFAELKSLTNPDIKKTLIEKFSDECDSAAVDLKAAAMPRQATAAIISFPSMNPKEIHAPGFHDGERVALIRHPHGGIFEIPELIVNNKNPEAISVLGKEIRDAVGIHPSVAAKLSGADFDGDTVLVIPNDHGEIKTRPSVQSLIEFDTKAAYPRYEGMPKMTMQQKETEMGKASNLITDMTIKRATNDEITRAVKYSMVVIDAEKHDLNYKLAFEEMNIPDLKRKYQGGTNGGASTIISQAGSEERVPLRKEQTKTDPVTGQKIYQYITGETYLNKKGHKAKVTTPYLDVAEALPGETYRQVTKKYKDPGTKKWVTVKGYKDPISKQWIDILPSGITEGDLKVTESQVKRTTKSTKMAETSDARTLSSGQPIETIYAAHANALKDMANKARLIVLNTPSMSYSHDARITYSKEVQSLNSSLDLVQRHKPLERKALALAEITISQERAAKPGMDKGELKKLRGRALVDARSQLGTTKPVVEINDREWEAIQAGAISSHTLGKILNATDLDKLRERALPKGNIAMSPARVARARAMLAADETIADVAQALGVSPATIDKIRQ